MQLFSSVILFLSLSSTVLGLAVYPDQQTITESKDPFQLIRHALKRADIIDGVVDDFQPRCFLAPFYGKKQKPVVFGNKLKRSVTKERPSLKVYCPDVKTTPGLTIALTDPDAPSRKNPEWAEMCHWIIPIAAARSQDQNPTSQDLEFNIDLDCSSEIVGYKPPGPPKKTGYHRYVFILLEGDATNLTAPADRQHWGTGKKGHGVRDWAEKEELKPVGGNYFVEKH